MTLYDLVKFLHVLGAIGLFGGTAITVAGMVGLRRATTAEGLRPWALMASFPARLLPSTIVLLLFAGVYLAATRWGLATPWIDVALIAYLVMLPPALAINLRRLLAIDAGVKRAPSGPLADALRARIRDRLLWTSVLTMTGVDLGIVFVMTVKPVLLLALIALAVGGSMGLVSALVSSRQPGAAPMSGSDAAPAAPRARGLGR